ncbi:hypothetical protein [uncultured Caulobacter sp.]|uniref:hypothetical protein n=1 Tax=uncultured Caulobacter sp. TaxID=158749 RepID=UPI002623BA8C|nr:hypothetical protein [uncultured Caulobacter sp.]
MSQRQANGTPGPWSQGVTLRTSATARWTADQFAENDLRERRMVFARFSARDGGRSRQLVAMCERPEDASLVAAAPDLLSACQSVIPKNLATDNRNIPDDQIIPLDFTMGELRRIAAAIAKATPSETRSV